MTIENKRYYGKTAYDDRNNPAFGGLQRLLKMGTESYMQKHILARRKNDPHFEGVPFFEYSPDEGERGKEAAIIFTRRAIIVTYTGERNEKMRAEFPYSAPTRTNKRTMRKHTRFHNPHNAKDLYNKPSTLEDIACGSTIISQVLVECNDFAKYREYCLAFSLTLTNLVRL